MYTLRHLPLPAKLVASVFLVAVGLGYFSALVQMHLQHSSREGEPLPSAADVVAIFAGKKKFDPNAPKPVSKLEKLVMGPRKDSPWNGSGSMAPAFFESDGEDYKSLVKDDPAIVPKLDAEREGERKAVQLWIRLPDAERLTAYDNDRLPIPKDFKITESYMVSHSIKIKSILNDRCGRCHSKDNEQENYPLETYAQLLKYMEVPTEAPDAKGWITSDRQMSVEKLTQSTHAHLLSFAMLFGLTGFLFAFTSYPKAIRLFVAPIVLIAQVADVSCWWLARLPEMGPSFALAIIGTGTVVGLGLFIQILGCLFDMYGRRGRFVLIVIFTLAAAGFGMLYTRAIEPALQAEKTAKAP